MIESSDFRTTKMPLNHGAGDMPALGFGTLIPDAAATITATRDALEAGFRHFDCAERYRNEREVGEALQAGLAAGGIAREDIFVTTKLWNTNHRPERVGPAFEASLGQTRAQLSGSLSHSHSICVSTGGRAGSARSKRQCHLRQRRDFARYLESDGESRGPAADAGPSDCLTSPWTDCCPSTNPRESSRPWSRSKHIRIFRKRSFWNSARRRALCFWLSRRWVTE